MINQEQKELVIAAYGKHYTKTVIESLCSAGILNSQSNAFSANDIKKFVNGFRENELVEIHILTEAVKIIEEKKRFQKSISKKAKRLLN